MKTGLKAYFNEDEALFLATKSSTGQHKKTARIAANDWKTPKTIRQQQTGFKPKNYGSLQKAQL